MVIEAPNADRPTPPSEDDPQTVCLEETAFKDDAWLGVNLLTKYNVLEYFSRSPFYVPPTSVDEQYLLLEEQEPHLYVIGKQLRSKTLAVYYILDQTVFQAPSLCAVLGARTARCLHNLKHAFSCAQSLYDPLYLGGSSGSEDHDATAAKAPQASVSFQPAATADKVEHERATERLMHAILGKKMKM